MTWLRLWVWRRVERVRRWRRGDWTWDRRCDGCHQRPMYPNGLPDAIRWRQHDGRWLCYVCSLHESNVRAMESLR